MQSPFALLIVAAGAIVGCSDGMGMPAAPGAGTSNDASASDAAMPDAPAMVTTDAPSEGGHLPASCVTGGAHSGSRWQDLYACYFGPTGIANCALNASCHVSGATMAGTWICGPSVDSCYQGLVSSGIVGDGGMPTAMTAMMAKFYASLRTTDGFGGTMPLDPPDVSFTPDDMSRILNWIQSGALNN